MTTIATAATASISVNPLLNPSLGFVRFIEPFLLPFLALFTDTDLLAVGDLAPEADLATILVVAAVAEK